MASARMKGNEQESTKAGTAFFIIVCINDGLAALTPNQIVFTVLVEVEKIVPPPSSREHTMLWLPWGRCTCLSSASPVHLLKTQAESNSVKLHEAGMAAKSSGSA